MTRQTFQIDETVDLDKQLYMVDKIPVEGEDKVETISKDDENTDDFGTSNEDMGGEEKLENLKESLNKEDEPLEPLIKWYNRVQPQGNCLAQNYSGLQLSQYDDLVSQWNNVYSFIYVIIYLSDLL